MRCSSCISKHLFIWLLECCLSLNARNTNRWWKYMFGCLVRSSSPTHIKQILSQKWSGNLFRKILARNWIDKKPNYFPFIRKLWIMFGLFLFFRLINHLHHRSNSFESSFIFNARTRKYNKHRKKKFIQTNFYGCPDRNEREQWTWNI